MEFIKESYCNFTKGIVRYLMNFKWIYGLGCWLEIARVIFLLIKILGYEESEFFFFYIIGFI